MVQTYALYVTLFVLLLLFVVCAVYTTTDASIQTRAPAPTGRQVWEALPSLVSYVHSAELEAQRTGEALIFSDDRSHPLYALHSRLYPSSLREVQKTRSSFRISLGSSGQKMLPKAGTWVAETESWLRALAHAAASAVPNLLPGSQVASGGTREHLKVLHVLRPRIWRGVIGLDLDGTVDCSSKQTVIHTLCSFWREQGYAVVVITARGAPVNVPLGSIARGVEGPMDIYYNAHQTQIPETKLLQLQDAHMRYTPSPTPIANSVLLDDQHSNVQEALLGGARAYQVRCLDLPAGLPPDLLPTQSAAF